MPFQVLDPQPGEATSAIIQRADNRLFISGTSANPNVDVDCAIAGTRYFNENTFAQWICQVPGAASSTVVWAPVIYSVVAATDTQAGIVELATVSETAAGTDNTKAVTPASMAGAFQTVAAHDADFGVLQSQIDSNDDDIATIFATFAAANSIATPDTLVEYNAEGNIEVAEPTADEDATTKLYVDDADAVLQAQITTNTNDLVAATSAASGGKLARRNGSGNIEVGTATGANEAINKAIHDALSAVVATHTTTLNNATSSPTADRLALRDANGRCQFVAGTAAADAVIKSQLDAVQSDADDNATDILTNAGDIAALEALVDTMPGGKDYDTLTLATDKATPTASIVRLAVQTGSADNCSNLLTSNTVRVLFVKADDPTKPITLQHEENATDGFFTNSDAGDIVLDDAGKAVVYTLLEDTVNSWVEFCRIGFDSGGGGGGSASLFKPENITETLRILPDSGNISGTYVMYNETYTAAGTLNVVGPTKIYARGGSLTFLDITQTRPSNGGVGVASNVPQGGPGSGPGGGQGGNQGCAGGGAGGPAGTAGGTGGYYSATNYVYVGSQGYSFLSCLEGSGGGSGASSASYAGADGGDGGQSLVIETFNCNTSMTGNVTLTGGAGTTQSTSATYTGSGSGGSGGTFMFIGGGTTTFSLSASKAINVSGGNGGGGSYTYATSPGGGGAGGYIHITTEVASGVTISGSLTYSGGTRGSTGLNHYQTNGSAGASYTSDSITPISLVA